MPGHQNRASSLKSRKSRSQNEVNRTGSPLERSMSHSSYDCSYTSALTLSSEDDSSNSDDTELWRTAHEDENYVPIHIDHYSSDGNRNVSNENMNVSDEGSETDASSSEDEDRNLFRVTGEDRNFSGVTDKNDTDDQITNSGGQSISRSFKQSTPKSFDTERESWHDGIEKRRLKKQEKCSSSIQKEASNIRFFLEPTKGVMLLVMPVPSEITFYGQAQIRALSGSVNICGFEVSAAKHRFYPIFSVRDIFSFQIKAKRYQLMSSQHQEDLKSYLKKFFDRQELSNILNCCKFTSAVVILKQFRVTQAVDFVSLYCPKIFNSSSKVREEKLMQKFRKFHFAVDGTFFKEPHTYVSLGEAIVKEIEGREVNLKSNPSESASCIMVYGPQAVGKSSLLRYLINRVLSVYPKIMYLDLDPGQTEFTPPACLSLNEVTEPLLGPPFTHEKSPVMQAFYGSVSILPSGYFNVCVQNLYSFYRQSYRHVPLFVNMFGWMEDVGKELLDFTKGIVNPTLEVMLEENIGDDSFRTSPIPDLSEPEKTKILIRSASITESRGRRKMPLLCRELMLLAYLGRCQPYYDAPKYLNCFKPYKVKVKDIVIHLMHYDVDPPSLIKALNATFVALCIVHDDNILVCAEQHCECPKKLKDPCSLGTCVGFGFIRAIDEMNGILYFVSPEPPEKLCEVNTFVKGNVNTPQMLMKNQDIFGVPLPYLHTQTKRSLSKLHK